MYQVHEDGGIVKGESISQGINLCQFFFFLLLIIFFFMHLFPRSHMNSSFERLVFLGLKLFAVNSHIDLD